MYVLYQQIGLYDTQIGLALIYQVFAVPFAVWLLQSFFREVPRDLGDSARVDGCSELQSLAAHLPAAGRAGHRRPTGILVGINMWNEVTIALSLTFDQATHGDHRGGGLSRLRRAQVAGDGGRGDDRSGAHAVLRAGGAALPGQGPDVRSGEVSDLMGLVGRRALVTGAGRGIGRAIALRLAADGADVVVNDRDPATASSTAERIRGAGTPGRGRRRRPAPPPAQVHEVCDAAVEALGGIDIVVNNAGISLYRSIIDCTEHDWDDHLDIMAKATFLTMRRLAPAMMERGWGRIVNLGSYVAQMNCTTKYFGPYCAAKFAIVGLTQVAAQEFAPAVTVNAVGPGDVETEMMEAEWVLEGERRDLPAAAIKEEYRRRLILGRLERPEDIAGAVAFLCSPAADHVTASHLIVSGGLPYHA